jgi:DICT domain-containing protein/signal transduction histidine kinase
VQKSTQESSNLEKGVIIHHPAVAKQFMIIQTSLLQQLLEVQPQLRMQMYFKSSLTALSHAMEDQVLAGSDQPLVIACFQRERFYRQEANRYLRIAEKTPHVFVLAAPESDFCDDSGPYESIAFQPEDGLSQEWHLVVLGQQYSVCLVCREHPQTSTSGLLPPMDQARRFEGIWTFERAVTCEMAALLLDRICQYRPELTPKVKFLLENVVSSAAPATLQINPAPFSDRLVTYLQAGQYRQLKAYRQIALREQKERLINTITSAIRRSLHTNEVLQVAVQELGDALSCQRCLLYQCDESDEITVLRYEWIQPGQISLLEQAWSLKANPFFQELAKCHEWVDVEDVKRDPRLRRHRLMKQNLQAAQVYALLLVPILHQGRLLGVIELHHTEGEAPYRWSEAEVALVEAIATQVGIALIQSQAYSELEDLNQQLEALERARSNLIAITGHELRTPLSTIQVCLESLASEPDMDEELRQVMLHTALTDAERMRKLVQDFLTLSRLESGRVKWHAEALLLQECVEMALSSLRTRNEPAKIPTIAIDIPEEIPMVQADGEWLVEVLTKLLDNACKFTPAKGKIWIRAREVAQHKVEVVIGDTGRGIEPDRLETVFERFYQEEGALRRTVGGTGLGLAISRQIILNFGGEIWATSAGKEQGSEFHFTLAMAPLQAQSTRPSISLGDTA